MIPDDCWCYTILPFCNDEICRNFYITCKYSRMLVLEHLRTTGRYIAAVIRLRNTGRYIDALIRLNIPMFDYIALFTKDERLCPKKIGLPIPHERYMVWGEKNQHQYNIEYISSSPLCKNNFKGYVGGIVFSCWDGDRKIKMKILEYGTIQSMISELWVIYYGYLKSFMIIELNNKERLLEVYY